MAKSKNLKSDSKEKFVSIIKKDDPNLDQKLLIMKRQYRSIKVEKDGTYIGVERATEPKETRVGKDPKEFESKGE